MSNKERSDKDVANEKDVEFIRQMIKEYRTFGDLYNSDFEDTEKIYKALEIILSERNQDKKRIQELEEEREKVLDLIFEYGQIDGDHHKTWVIDQIVRMLTKDKYNEWVKNYVYDEETGDVYSWDKGIAP